MTKVTTTCPMEFLYLRNWIQAFDKRPIGKHKRKLSSYLQDCFPTVWERVRIKDLDSKGRQPGRGVRLNELLKLLDLPLHGTCKQCGEKTGEGQNGISRAPFCSSKCSNNNEGVWDAKKRTWTANLGVDSPSKNAEVFRKQQKSRYYTKKFVSSNGGTHSYQGYEGFVLNFLDRHPQVKKFSTRVGENMLPTTPYERTDGQHSSYYPDIGVTLKNGRQLVIEVKSEYTLWSEEEQNVCKFKAAEKLCRKLGKEFWLAVVYPSDQRVTWTRANGRSITVSL